MRHNEYTPETFRMHFLTFAFDLSQKLTFSGDYAGHVDTSKRGFATFRMHGLAILRHFVCKVETYRIHSETFRMQIRDISYAKVRQNEYRKLLNLMNFN